jgi:hypothetical protein
MIKTLEEETYSVIELLQQEDSKKTCPNATKLLLKISQAIALGHMKLQQHLALNKASPRAYLDTYHRIMQADRLFELEALLKEALGVREKTRERIKAVQQAKRPRFPIRLRGDRYKPPQKKVEPAQLGLPW